MHFLRVFAPILLATAPVVHGYDRGMQARRDLANVITSLFGNFTLGSLGTVSCNVARAQILKAIDDTKQAVKEVSESDVRDAALAGLKQADEGVKTIIEAVLSGQKPPTAGRDTINTGITATANALMNAPSNETAVIDAMNAIAASVKAGASVVANC